MSQTRQNAAVRAAAAATAIEEKSASSGGIVTADSMDVTPRRSEPNTEHAPLVDDMPEAEERPEQPNERNSTERAQPAQGLQPLEKVRAESAHLGEIRRTRALLHAAPKIKIIIPPVMGVKKQPDVVVTINDYSYQMMRNRLIEVPEPVYQVLVSSGIVLPMREDDEFLAPQVDETLERRWRFANPEDDE